MAGRVILPLPDGLRDRADAGDHAALRDLTQILANRLDQADDFDSALDELERYIRTMASSGEHTDQCALAFVLGIRAGYCEGRADEAVAVAGAIVAMDEMADAGFDDAAVALYAIPEMFPAGVSEDAFAIAGAVRSVARDTNNEINGLRGGEFA
jgi:sigma54-dependent transcription regulator